MDSNIEDDAIEEVEQADMQRAIKQSLVDLVVPVVPSATQPSLDETSSS